MKTKYNMQFHTEDIVYNLKRLTNQIYKLLPNREEGIDWQKPLETIVEELVGMNGANHGIHSAMYFHPEKKYGFVVICNGCNSKSYADSGLNNEVIRMLYNSIIKEH